MITITVDESAAGFRRIPFVVRDMTNLLPEDGAGLTFSAAEIQVSKNGAASGNSAGSVVEIGGGLYYYQCTAGEVDTKGFVTIHVVKTGYTGRAIAYICSANISVIADRIGPWTADTAKNSIYGAARAMANPDDDFTSADLTKDDGDGAGSFNNVSSSLGGIRSITGISGLALPDGLVLGTDGDSTTVFTLPTADLSSNSVSTLDNAYRDNEVVFYTGGNAGMTLPVESYDGTTRKITLSANRPAAATPSTGDVIFIRRGAAQSTTTESISAIASSTSTSDNDGRRVFVKAGVQASLSVNPSGSSNNYKVTAWAAGTDGNALTLTVVDPGNTNTLSVSVSTVNVTVTLGHNGSAITTTSSDLVSAINNYEPSYRLMYAEVTEQSLVGFPVAALTQTSLSGGTASTGSDSNDGLTRGSPKATVSGALAVVSAGTADIVHLDRGVHTITGNSILPRNVSIEGEGPDVTRLRIGANTADLFGALHIRTSESCTFKDLYIDGAMCFAAAVYTGGTYAPPAKITFENVHGRAPGYFAWASGGNTIGANIQKQVWRARNCRFRSGISAWAFQGSSTVRHEAEAFDCYFEADDALRDGSASNDTFANVYSVLVTDADCHLENCTMVARHHHVNRTSYGLQSGSPTDVNRPGRVTFTNCRFYSEHTQASAPVAITNVSAESQVIVTSAGHGLSNNTLLWIAGVTGTGAITNVNRTCRVSDVTTDTFKLKDPYSGSYISTAGGTYDSGGHYEIKPWDILSLWDGSLIVGADSAVNPTAIEVYLGEYVDRQDNLEHKLSILQGSEQGFVIYASSDGAISKTLPYSRGWMARNPYSTIAAAVNESVAGVAVYLSSPCRPLEISDTIALPSKVDIHGHKNKTKIVHTGTDSAFVDAFFSSTGFNLIEELFLDDQSSNGVDGVQIPSGAGRVIVDHCVIAVDGTGVDVSSSTASVATIENTRIVAGQYGVYLAGAAHLSYIVGDHPHINADVGLRVTDGSLAVFNDGYITSSTTGVSVDDASIAKLSDAAVVGTTDDITADGAGTKVFVPSTGYDPDNTTESNSGLIVSGSIGEVVLDDIWGASIASYTTSQAGGILASVNSKIGTAQVSVVSPVATNGTITIIKGDDYYNADNRALVFSNNDGTWPTLTSATVTLTATKGTETPLSIAGTITDGTGDSKSVYFEMSATESAALAEGSWKFRVTATLLSGNTATLVTGTMAVRD